MMSRSWNSSSAVGVFVSFSLFAVMQEDVYEAQGENGGERFSMTFFALVFERAVTRCARCWLFLSLVGVGINCL